MKRYMLNLFFFFASPALSLPWFGKSWENPVYDNQLFFSPDLIIWLHTVTSQHLATNLFPINPSHRHHLQQCWHPNQQPKFNSCAGAIGAPLVLTSASGQPYWSGEEGHRKICPLCELADFVTNWFAEWGGGNANSHKMILTVLIILDKWKEYFTDWIQVPQQPDTLSCKLKHKSHSRLDNFPVSLRSSTLSVF